MFDLISILASLALCIIIPLEASKVRHGWVRKNFVGDRAAFVAAYRKQLRLLIWLGLLFGVLGVTLAPLEDHARDATLKVIAGLMWFVVAGLSFFSLRTLESPPAARSPD